MSGLICSEFVPRAWEIPHRSFFVREDVLLRVPISPVPFVINLNAVAVRVLEVQAHRNTMISRGDLDIPIQQLLVELLQIIQGFDPLCEVPQPHLSWLKPRRALGQDR